MRFPLRTGRRLALAPGLMALLLTLGPGPTSVAQTGADDPPPSGTEEEADTSVAEEPEGPTRAERKRQAKERRIEEYLRKREERRAQKELEHQRREALELEEAARAIERQQIAEQQRTATAGLPAVSEVAAAPEPTPPEPAAERAPRRERRAPQEPREAPLPRGLARAQANIRATELGQDPTVQEYLSLIDKQDASPYHLAAFANFVAQNGMVDDAMEYYTVALRLEKRDPVLWVNRGTLLLQKGDPSTAALSFSKALSINPNSAVAHYNLGAAFDEMNRYDDAVAEYRTALTLDPLLGDPAVNPQAANNDLLLAVKLMLYQTQVGSLSVPLIDIPIDQAGAQTD